MGDYGGLQLLDDNRQDNSSQTAFHPFNFTSLDLLQKQNFFGFSPGTSPAPSDIKREAGGSYFDPQNRNMPIADPMFLDANDTRYQSSLKSSLLDVHLSQSLQQPSRLYIPATTSRQKHGQLTPPSETTPTKDDLLEESVQLSKEATVETQAGRTARKRRSTQQSQASEAPPQSTATPRRRKKSTRKQCAAESAADGAEKRSQFLERNRVAASKCRQKKKEWTSDLESRARELQASKTSLSLLVSSLREELLYLKGEALKHTTCDCTSVRDYLARHAEASLPRSHLDYSRSPCSSSNFSFEALDLGISTIYDSPGSSVTGEIQNLPELKMIGQIPD